MVITTGEHLSATSRKNEELPPLPYDQLAINQPTEVNLVGNKENLKKKQDDREASFYAE